MNWEKYAVAEEDVPPFKASRYFLSIAKVGELDALSLLPFVPFLPLELLFPPVAALLLALA